MKITGAKQQVLGRQRRLRTLRRDHEHARGETGAEGARDVMVVIEPDGHHAQRALARLAHCGEACLDTPYQRAAVGQACRAVVETHQLQSRLHVGQTLQGLAVKPIDLFAPRLGLGQIQRGAAQRLPPAQLP